MWNFTRLILFPPFAVDKTKTEMSLAPDHAFSRARTITQVFLDFKFFSILSNRYISLMFFGQYKACNYCNADIPLVQRKSFYTLSKFHWPFQYHRSRKLFNSWENSCTCGFHLLCQMNRWGWIWFTPWLNSEIGI